MAFIKMLVTSFAHSITSLFFIIVVMFTYFRIRRNAQLEEYWLGFLRSPVSTQLVNVVFFGMLIGLIASLLIVLIGITIDYQAVLFVWPLALILMLFNQRYMCFSYAGGIISLANLLTGWPKIDVSALIALIGVLHLMESMLILADGHRDSLPVWVEHDKLQPVGAYLLQKVWPIPLVVLVIPYAGAQLAANGGGVSMPDWWPLFRSQNVSQVYALFPIVAVLGYGDIAITRLPDERARESGLWLAVYSISVLTLAIVSSRVYWLKYVAAVSVPLFHELLVIVGKKRQLRGEPAFGVPWVGLRVLEVLPESPAEKMGIKRGDILLNVNGKSISSQEMLYEALGEYLYIVWVDVKRGDSVLSFEYTDYANGIDSLGLVFVPRNTGKYFRIEEQKGVIIRLWNKLRGNRRKSA
ncbi:MAG: PDZ domain-containing protein [Clostridiales bacterium]|nr:PDZ domain-containing protein [Clostridiales bacterium]